MNLFVSYIILAIGVGVSAYLLRLGVDILKDPYSPMSPVEKKLRFMLSHIRFKGKR